jgi:hypothetical protein
LIGNLRDLERKIELLTYNKKPIKKKKKKTNDSQALGILTAWSVSVPLRKSKQKGKITAL